jgi:hypothetical protein
MVAVMNIWVLMKGEEFLYYLSDCQLFRRDSLPLSYVEIAP